MRFRYPLDKYFITSPFGNRESPYPNESNIINDHNGIDLRAAEGSRVYSIAKGTVKSVYYTDKGGNQVVIEHDNGYRSGYAHLLDTIVAAGETVKAGQIIGYSGSTGGFDTMGPHLHLTVKKDNEYINPDTLNFINPINILPFVALLFVGSAIYKLNK